MGAFTVRRATGAFPKKGPVDIKKGELAPQSWRILLKQNDGARYWNSPLPRESSGSALLGSSNFLIIINSTFWPTLLLGFTR